MSRQEKASKHLGRGQAKAHDRQHKNDKYNIHKLSTVVSHNRYERNHGGESAK